jgi:hypothetical protein
MDIQIVGTMQGIASFASAGLRSLVAAIVLTGGAQAARAFGDEGHRAVALIARAQMTAAAVAAADRLIATDTSSFNMTYSDGKPTSSSFDREATWADYYRSSQQTVPNALPNQVHTYAWHFVDIELQGGSLQTACFDFPKLAPGTLASQGPDPDCVVNKIEQFAAELGSDSTSDAEKLLALKFLMHFVGDLHQPLHATDNLDHGGNTETAIVGTKSALLHSHWDNTFVSMIGAQGDVPNTDPQAVVAALRKPTPIEVAQWTGPANPRVWALESYALAQSYAYGSLPKPTVSGTTATYQLDAKYTKNAVLVTQDQLLRAGYRLAAILNSAFAH